MNYTTFKITNFDFDEQEFRNSVVKHVAFIQYYYNPINQTIWLQMININTITSLRKLFSKYFPSFTFSSSKPGTYIFYSTFPTLIPRRHILIKRSESLIDFLQ